MSAVQSLRPNLDHWPERVDLACALRWTARLNMHEGVANHFSLAVSDDGQQFLMNPNQKHFSRLKASDLILIDAQDPTTMDRPDAPDPTAWALHGAVHRALPQARCIMHVHSKYATVLASLLDSSMPPIDQNTMRFYGKVVVDDGYDGMGLGDEAERVASLMRGQADKTVLIMGNHGIMIFAPSVAYAFDEMYYFERSAETLVTAYMTGKPLRVASHEVAEKTARQWREYPGLGDLHFAELRAMLDAEGEGWRG